MKPFSDKHDTDWDVCAISSVQLFAHKKRGCTQTQMQVSYHQSFQKGKSVTDPTTSPPLLKSCIERSLLPDVVSQTLQPRHSGETFSLPCHTSNRGSVNTHTHTHTHTLTCMHAQTHIHVCMHTHACTQTTCTHTYTHTHTQSAQHTHKHHKPLSHCNQHTLPGRERWAHLGLTPPQFQTAAAPCRTTTSLAASCSWQQKILP